ncbi:putative transcription factor bHLH family [Helianthus annuus]|nr:putative transcription factor bHLH family [Helianthus annuus]
MLALYPSLFPTTHGWALEYLFNQNLPHGCNESNSYNPPFNFHTIDQIKLDLAPEYFISLGETTNVGTGDEMMVAKKLNHNTTERDRRKRVNELYSLLRSLLPVSSDQKVKYSKDSITCSKIHTRTTKGSGNIKCKKEKLLLYSSSTPKTRKDHFGIRTQSGEETMIKTKSSVTSSVSIFSDKEAVIQLISSADHLSNNKRIDLLSKVLDYLE